MRVGVVIVLDHAVNKIRGIFKFHLGHVSCYS